MAPRSLYQAERSPWPGQGAFQADQALTERAVLEYVIQRAPDARLRDFMDFPKVLLEQSARAQIDFRMILSAAVVESDLQPAALDDLKYNVRLSILYLRDQVEYFNDLKAGLRAYNEGPQQVVPPGRRQAFSPHRDTNTTEYVMAVALAHLETTAWFSRRGILPRTDGRSVPVRSSTG